MLLPFFFSHIQEMRRGGKKQERVLRGTNLLIIPSRMNTSREFFFCRTMCTFPTFVSSSLSLPLSTLLRWKEIYIGYSRMIHYISPRLYYTILVRWSATDACWQFSLVVHVWTHIIGDTKKTLAPVVRRRTYLAQPQTIINFCWTHTVVMITAAIPNTRGMRLCVNKRERLGGGAFRDKAGWFTANER